MKGTAGQNRLNRLRAVLTFVAAALFVKVFLSILYEYRFYFPADFDSAFLSGRQGSFYGHYCVAFYAHIVSGPLALVGGSLLMLSRGRRRYRELHRWAGRILAVIVLAILLPSGLVMARRAFAGPIAGVGFAALSITTAACMAFAVHYARRRQFQMHQKWACRFFILLCSPLLLRLISGSVTVMRLESDWFYRLNAWFSWLIPLAIYEVWCCSQAHHRSYASSHLIHCVTEEALP
ncbi:MAG TPA: DUF2306 domain-containing protein [Planctomycetes bacterium]|nr:DUF2306 domain-containing protein [Planctomycetota bacterium]